MSVMNKPDYKIFAQDAKSGEYVAFPDILRGWGITLEQYNGFPPMELFNSAAKRIDEWLMYLTQRGLPEWDAAVDYPKDAMIQHAGVYYVSLKVTKGEQPNNSQASWKKLTEALGVDGKLAKDQNGADIPNKPKFIENLRLPELLDKKFDKTGGKITASGKAIEIEAAADTATYIQITDTQGNILHQLGKRDASNDLFLSNVSERGNLVVNGDGVRFNGNLLGFNCEALTSSAGYITIPTFTNGVKRNLILQWRYVSVPESTSGTMASVEAAWPIPFPSACISIICSFSNGVSYLTSGTPFCSTQIVDRATFKAGSGYSKSVSTLVVWGIGY